MIAIEDKISQVLAHEESFAESLALRVLEKPRLSVWMILIPIIFVYFFYRYQRYTTGRVMFKDNYMISRRRAMKEASEIIMSGKEPDIEALARLSDLPEAVYDRHSDMLAILVEHYTDLLRSEGNDLDQLVRSAYRSRTNYLLFLNRLNQAEKALNSALEPHLSATEGNIHDILQAIETHSETLRRQSADMFFG